MDELIKKLQNEAGISEQEAISSISIIKKYMDEHRPEINWERFFIEKHNCITEKTKELYAEMIRKTREYSDKIEEKAEDLTLKAKRKANNLNRRATDFSDDKACNSHLG